MDPLAGVENAALVEGVKFLYQQAAEVLSAWRARRRDRQATAERGRVAGCGPCRTPAAAVGSGKPGDG